MADLYRVYRRGTDPATSQDWAIRATDISVEIRSGATGAPAKYVEISASGCQQGIPEAEVATQTEGKIADGYVAIGWGDYERGRLHLVRREPGTGTKLYWEIKDVPRAKMTSLLGGIVGDLKRTSVASVPTYADVPTGAKPEVIGMTVPLPPVGEWKLAAAGRKPGDVWRGSGVVERTHGVVPLLVLMRIARDLPGTVSLADENAEEVTVELKNADPWVGRKAGPTDETEAIAVELGLCRKSSVVASGMTDIGPGLSF